MAVRVIVRLTSKWEWQKVADRLQEVGVEGLIPPTLEWPDCMVALFPADSDPGEATELARTVEGVVTAYADTWRHALSTGS